MVILVVLFIRPMPRLLIPMWKFILSYYSVQGMKADHTWVRKVFRKNNITPLNCRYKTNIYKSLSNEIKENIYQLLYKK